MTLLRNTNPFSIHESTNSPPDASMHEDSLANYRHSHQAFENTSTNVAASQMRNALNNLTDTVKDDGLKKVRTMN